MTDIEIFAMMLHPIQGNRQVLEALGRRTDGLVDRSYIPAGPDPEEYIPNYRPVSRRRPLYCQKWITKKTPGSVLLQPEFDDLIRLADTLCTSLKSPAGTRANPGFTIRLAACLSLSGNSRCRVLSLVPSPSSRIRLAGREAVNRVARDWDREVDCAERVEHVTGPGRVGIHKHPGLKVACDMEQCAEYVSSYRMRAVRKRWRRDQAQYKRRKVSQANRP